jgi:hypothetical protein
VTDAAKTVAGAARSKGVSQTWAKVRFGVCQVVRGRLVRRRKVEMSALDKVGA